MHRWWGALGLAALACGSSTGTEPDRGAPAHPAAATAEPSRPPTAAPARTAIAGRWYVDLETLEAEDDLLRETLAVIGIERTKIADAYVELDPDGGAVLAYDERRVTGRYEVRRRDDGRLEVWLDARGDGDGPFAVVDTSGDRMVADWPLRYVRPDVPLLRAGSLARTVAEMGRACDAGDLEQCNRLGEWLELGRGVPLDKAAAAERFRTACYGPEPTSGYGFGAGAGGGGGAWRGGGLIGGGDDSLSNGRDAAWPRGCSNLAVLYRDGEGVEESWRKAAVLNDMACRANDDLGCHNLGIAFAEGQGVSKDLPRAIAYFDKACATGRSDISCYHAQVLRKH